MFVRIEWYRIVVSKLMTFVFASKFVCVLVFTKKESGEGSFDCLGLTGGFWCRPIPTTAD